MNFDGDQPETEVVRSLLDDLLEESRLYKDSKDHKELLDFVVRLRNFAPFNAMLLQVQKPGLSYAASERDWYVRFGRQIKRGARPLLILWPFGPVALVYDVMDTDGDELPEDVASFVARGEIDVREMENFLSLLENKNVFCDWVDAGDRNAGSIYRRPSLPDEYGEFQYRLSINKNHNTAVQFGSLAHELAHLYLGHLGRDNKLKVPERPIPDHSQREVEAESVAYIVCKRNGIEPKSQTYLSGFVGGRETTEGVAVYQIMRAAGQIEALLKLATPTRFSGPPLDASLGATKEIEPGFKPKLDPARAAYNALTKTPQIKRQWARPKQKRKPALLALLLVAIAVAAAITFYEITNSYENCILRNMPGTPPNAAYLIERSCRRIAR